MATVMIHLNPVLSAYGVNIEKQLLVRSLLSDLRCAYNTVRRLSGKQIADIENTIINNISTSESINSHYAVTLMAIRHIIYKEQAHILENACVLCGKICTTRCAMCGNVKYFSKECQTKDWKYHKTHCCVKK